MAPEVLHYFRYPGFAEPNVKKINLNLKKVLPFIEVVETEFCFNVQPTEPLSSEETTVSACDT